MTASSASASGDIPTCAVYAPPKSRAGEVRTLAVVILTAVMMVAELIVGTFTHSLALVADGWHMATHVGALGVAALAYWYARTRAGHTQFAFGTGKIYALGGYTSAVLLFAVAISMIAESVHRFVSPEQVNFAEALPVAILGLVVNLVSAWILDIKDNPETGIHADDGSHDHAHGHSHHHGHHHGDQNLKAAYLHVIADALTSVLAIAALLVGRYLGWGWIDPLVAVVGSAVIIAWGVNLIRECARQLVDLDPSTELRDRVRSALEKMGDTRVEDLHLWRVGPAQLVCVIAVSSSAPKALHEYKQAAIDAAPISHLTVEICARGSESIAPS